MDNDDKYKSEIDPVSATYHRKLTSPAQATYSTGTDGNAPTIRELSPITKALMKRRADAENIFDILPDMSYIIATAVSSLTCSKDLVTTALVYESSATSEDIPFEFKEAMLDVIRDFYNKEDELPQNLYRWLYQAMAFSGATPVMVVSESAFDKMFNLKREGFAASLDKINGKGLIDSCFDGGKTNAWGPIQETTSDVKSLRSESFISSFATNTGGVSFDPLASMDESDPFEQLLIENLKSTSNVYLTDDVNIAKLPKLKKHLNGESFGDKLVDQHFSSYNDSTEEEKGPIGQGTLRGAKDLNPDYDKRYGKENYMEVPTSLESGRSKTHGMRFILPSESVIPVTMPGSEDEPCAYLVIHDSGGNPASGKNIGTIESSIYTSNTGFNELVNTMARSLDLDPNDVNNLVPKISSKYADITERQMIKSLENGKYGEGVSIGKNDDFYRIMAARHMAKRDTYVLCVPAEQMSYFTVDRDINGIGRSIIEKTKVLSTARMVHLFSTMRTMINNSSRDLVYTINLPDEELDPEGAIARIEHMAMNKHNRNAPEWGDPNDTYAKCHNSGLHFKVQGGENYPTTDIDIADNTPDFKVPDKELDDMFTRRVCTAALVDPDLVLQPENIEFASQIWSKSLISTKQIIMKQQEVNKTLTNYGKMYTLSSGPILDKLAEAIKSTKSMTEEQLRDIPRYIRLFINSLTISLTQPDTTFTKSQMEEYDAKIVIIKNIVENTITDEVAEEVGVDSNKLRQIIVSWYSMSWLRNNAVETDLLDIFLSDNEHVNIVKDITDRHTTIGGLMKRIDASFDGKLRTVSEKYGRDEAGGEVEGEGSELASTDNEFGESDDEISDDPMSAEFGDESESDDDIDSPQEVDLGDAIEGDEEETDVEEEEEDDDDVEIKEEEVEDEEEEDK